MRRCLNCMDEYSEDNREICPYCGYAEGKTQDGVAWLPPGSILQGRYIVGTVISVRDVDVIYHGWDALFERKVQIQEYFPRYCATRAGQPEVSIYDAKQERYQEGLELFYRQSRELLRLYKEDGVVTYHACFKENKTAYAIMDDRNDKTLEEWMGGRTLKVKEALSLLWEAIGVIDECHRISVYHGLISTRTFWVTGAKKLILKDFGAWRYCSGEPGIVDYGKAGIHTDVYGMAKLFCQMITGKDIADGEKLEAELLKGKVTLKKTAVAALKSALSHDTKSLHQFREELYGSAGRKRAETSNPMISQRKNARNSLTLPRWMVGGAAAAAVVVTLTLAVLVGSGAIVKIRSGESQLGPDEVRVPNILQLGVEDAEQKLQNVNLVLQQEEMRNSEEVAEDLIFYQNMKEGSIAKKGDIVSVYVSLGKKRGVLPLAEGHTWEDAKEMLNKEGFYNVSKEEDELVDGEYGKVVQVKLQEHSVEDGKAQTTGLKSKFLSLFEKDEQKEGKQQEKESGPIPLDTEVILVVCMKETNILAEEDIKVPNLIGMERNKAAEVLEKLELKISVVEENSDKPEGTVLEQNPQAGQEANRGAYVTVRVSKGAEKIYMENVQLMTEQEARSTIEGLGLTVGTVTRQYSSSIAAGKVISQSVAQDQEVKKGDNVNLVISNGRDPAQQKTGAGSTTKAQVQATTEATSAQATQTQPETTAANVPEESVTTNENQEVDKTENQDLVIVEPGPGASPESTAVEATVSAETTISAGPSAGLSAGPSADNSALSSGNESSNSSTDSPPSGDSSPGGL